MWAGRRMDGLINGGRQAAIQRTNGQHGSLHFLKIVTPIYTPFYTLNTILIPSL